MEVTEESPEFPAFVGPYSGAGLVEDAVQATDPVSHTVT